jgi:hypothetical protein
MLGLRQGLCGRVRARCAAVPHGSCQSAIGPQLSLAAMDQAALTNQVLFRHQSQCREDSDLDYQILQILRVTLFEKVPILQALEASSSLHIVPRRTRGSIIIDSLR